MYAIIRGASWWATIKQVPAGMAAAKILVVKIRLGSAVVAARTFKIGDALDTTKFEAIADIETWLRTKCGSRELKWNVLAFVVGLFADGEYRVEEPENGEIRLYPAQTSALEGELGIARTSAPASIE